jgi:type IX secretion system PorP/SprF family membrane protein
MKKLLLIIIGLVISWANFAQQLPQYSQYLRNQYMINPGSAGVYDFLDVTTSGRWQWLGFDNSPRTIYLSATKPLNKKAKPPYNPALRTSTGVYKNPEINTGKFKHAVGGQMIADQYGAFRRLSLSGTYAIHIPVSKNYNLSFGTKLGLSNNAFLQDRAEVLNSASDNSYQSYIGNNKAKYVMDLGAGLYLYSKDLFVGISADQLTRDFVKFGSGTAFFDQRMVLFLTAGYKVKLNENMTITPALLLKYMSPAPSSVEGTLLFEYQERIWGGLSYRHKDALVAMFGLNVNEKIKLGYSYDYSISSMNRVSTGGHELILGLMIGR